MSKMLENKVALVTGGGRGIGEASGRLLAQHGAKVILADLDVVSAQAVADDIKTQGGEAAALEFNVADFDRIQEKVDAAKAIYGSIDILVNIAGITGSRPIEEITFDSWDKMMNIDLKAMFFLTQAVFTLMHDQRPQKYSSIHSFRRTRQYTKPKAAGL